MSPILFHLLLLWIQNKNEKKKLLKRKLPYIHSHTHAHTFLSIIFVFILDICQFNILAILHVYMIWCMYTHLVSEHGFYLSSFSFRAVFVSRPFFLCSQNWHLFWFFPTIFFSIAKKEYLLFECAVVSLTIFLFNAFRIVFFSFTHWQNCRCTSYCFWAFFSLANLNNDYQWVAANCLPSMLFERTE